jgi:hypothetical protein
MASKNVGSGGMTTCQAHAENWKIDRKSGYTASYFFLFRLRNHVEHATLRCIQFPQSREKTSLELQGQGEGLH